VVPERDPSERRDYTALATALTQITASVLAITLAIIGYRQSRN
jgi:hypothetical protein